MIFCTLCNLAMTDGYCLHMNVDSILMAEFIEQSTLDAFALAWQQRLREAPCKQS